jgi:uncharacterized protein YcaQ
MRAVVAVQTQYAASLPVALLARSKTYPKNWHERALKVGTIAKSWTLRHTVHTQCIEDHALLLAAIGPHWRKLFDRWSGQGSGLTREQFAQIEAGVLEALETGPRTRQEIHALVPMLAGLPWSGWGMDVKGLAYHGSIAFANNDGVTRFRLHSLPAQVASGEEAAKEVARRYFKAYGPATFQDFTYWCQMPNALAKKVVGELEGELSAVTVEGLAGRRFAYGDLEAPTPRGVRLLPKFDPLALAHRDKSMFFTPVTAKLVFRPAGQIEALVLSDGEIVGTWRIKRGAVVGEITVFPFRSLGPRAVGRIEKEAARIARALGLKGMGVRVDGTG